MNELSQEEIDIMLREKAEAVTFMAAASPPSNESAWFFVEFAKAYLTLTTCRDHWKTSFEHERANVLRLRQEIYEFHEDQAMTNKPGYGQCDCHDCRLVRQHHQPEAAYPPMQIEELPPPIEDAELEARDATEDFDPPEPDPMSPREQDAAADRYAGQRGIESDRRA